jgi:hypothetical protein
MSLPNNGGGDDNDDRTAHRLMMKGGIPSSPSSEDETAAETSIGSNSVVSGAPSTVVTVPDNDGVVAGARWNRAVGGPSSVIASDAGTNRADIPTQRRRYLRQLRTLGVATGATVALSAVSVIPAPLLIAMIVLMGIVALLIQTVVQVASFELRLLMQGRGIGDYLPTSLYEQLTQTSIHEFMSDRSTVDENAYMMLYFLPGLSRDQIDEYVGRLAPRHQELLHRRGLGFLLGENFMRFLVGDQRLRPTLEEHDEASDHGSSAGEAGSASFPLVPRRLELPPTIPEEVAADETSELGEEEDPAAQYARFWGVEPRTASEGPSNGRVSAVSAAAGAVPAVTSNGAGVVGREVSVTVATRNTGIASAVATAQMQNLYNASPSPSEENNVAIARAEEQVIYDAIGTSITTYMGVAANMVQTSARQSATLFSGTIFRASIGITMVSVGVGIYGFWTGAYNPQTFFQPTWRMLQSQVESFLRPPRSLLQGGWDLPSSQVLIGSTAASGATASIMFLFQMGSRRKDEKGKDEVKAAAAAAKNKGKKHSL